MGRYIGIDIGTLHSYVGYIGDDGKPKTLDDGADNFTPLFCKIFNEDVPTDAEALATERYDAQDTIRSIKEYSHLLQVFFNKEGRNPRYPQDIFACILSQLKSAAREKLGQIDGAVITVPAHTPQQGRDEMLLAAKDANIKVLQLIDKPKAALISYASLRQKYMHKTALVYDMGEGTFECSVVKTDFRKGNQHTEIVARDGDAAFGGIDWTKAVDNFFVKKASEKFGVDEEAIRNDPDNKMFFVARDRKIKNVLSYIHTASLDLFYKGESVKISMTRSEFDEETRRLLNHTVWIVDRMLNENKISLLHDLDAIFLVGGATAMPQIKLRLLKEYGLPVLSCEPEKSCALGAAVVANRYAKK